jgi:hypothetical protein
MKARQKQTSKPGAWSDFPDFERFWNAYVDMFWGDGGSTPYHDMLTADMEWLKSAYMANHEVLQQLEAKFIQSINQAQGSYETNIEASRIPISLNGKLLANVAPPGEQRTQEGLRNSRLQTAGLTHATKAGAAQRLLEGQQQFTPYAADKQFLQTLQQQGMQGQSARAGLPIQETTGKIPGPSTMSQLYQGVQVGSGALDLIGSLQTINNKYNIWDKATDFGGDIWNNAGQWGSDFWGWLTK